LPVGATTSLRRGGRLEDHPQRATIEVSGAVGAGQPAANRENVDGGIAGATTSRRRGGAMLAWRTMVLARWRDDELAAGRTTVLAHWRDD
jgi:hypothetical protein